LHSKRARAERNTQGIGSGTRTLALCSFAGVALACAELVGLEDHRLDEPSAHAGSAGAGGALAGGGKASSGGAVNGGNPSWGGAFLGEAPPSCASPSPGAGHDCGPGLDEDCCASFAVQGGDFVCRTLTESIEPFRLDKFEVTVGRFRHFAAAVDAGFRPPEGSGVHPRGANQSAADSGWNSAWDAHLPAGGAGDTWSHHFRRCDTSTWTEDDLGQKEWLPISCTTYYHALAFCIWDGGYLPSALELSYAASGGEEDRLYPWGEGPLDDQHAIYRSRERESPDPVGSVPAGDGRWFQSDLVGNVWEWCSYNGSALGECVGCECDRFVPDYENGRIFGGSYEASAAENTARSVNRIPLKPDIYLRDTGIRCARAP
jgi:formylglycine-generating enzyme